MFDDVVEFTQSEADRARLEAAYSRSIQSGNRALGVTGEDYVVNYLREQGVQVIGRQIGIRDVNGELRIYDALGRTASGTLTAFEVKTNGARRTDRQIRIDSSVMSHGGTVANKITAFLLGLDGNRSIDVRTVNVKLVPIPGI